MKIAILGSVALPVPPPGQGGTEWIAYYQAMGLSQRGHDVLLIASSGTKEHFSGTNVRVFEVGEGNLVAGGKKEQSLNPQTTESSRKLRLENAYLAEVAKILIDQKDSYDIILNNMRGEAVFLPVAKLLQKPFINVMHLNTFPELAAVFRIYKTQIITISNAQRTAFPDLSYVATVYNCVDTEAFVFNPVASDYLLMMGTVGEHKNQKAGIEVARKTGMKLVIAGKVRDEEYFAKLKPFFTTGQIEYRGELSFAEKVQLYQGAKALLFPILWEEPFGLVMIEAMACGTPVIAFRHGAVPEVVVEGKTGFIVDDVEQMAQAVGKVGQIKREDCRKYVEDHFTPEKMLDSLEKALMSV